MNKRKANPNKSLDELKCLVLYNKKLNVLILPKNLHKDKKVFKFFNKDYVNNSYTLQHFLENGKNTKESFYSEKERNVYYNYMKNNFILKIGNPNENFIDIFSAKKNSDIGKHILSNIQNFFFLILRLLNKKNSSSFNFNEYYINETSVYVQVYKKEKNDEYSYLRTEKNHYELSYILEIFEKVFSDYLMQPSRIMFLNNNFIDSISIDDLILKNKNLNRTINEKISNWNLGEYFFSLKNSRRKYLLNEKDIEYYFNHNANAMASIFSFLFNKQNYTKYNKCFIYNIDTVFLKNESENIKNLIDLSFKNIPLKSRKKIIIDDKLNLFVLYFYTEHETETVDNMLKLLVGKYYTDKIPGFYYCHSDLKLYKEIVKFFF